MSIPGSASPLFFQAAAADDAAAGPTRSLRFNRGDSAHLSRTPSSAGNSKTFTFSCWYKKTNPSASNVYQAIFDANNSSDYTTLYTDDGGTDALRLYVRTGGTNYNLKTTQVFRDYSAWTHIVLAVDTTESTAANRIKLYINGAQVTDFSSASYPPQNSDLSVNKACAHFIGGRSGQSAFYLNGYLADIYLIDGSALDATSFGAFDDNGVWQAAAYSGTYGTNGFHLDLSDNSSNAALGTDSSGNSNTFTVNNLVASVDTNSKGFKAVTYSGTGSSQSITSLAFQPDLVWIKVRNAGSSHRLFDSARGAGKHLLSDGTSAEATHLTSLSGFTSNGFNLGANGEGATNVNQSSGTYVAWCWKAGGTASSNTDGSITANVSANDTYGFSVIQFLGNATSGATVGHGLSSAPELVIGKNRGGGDAWWVWFKSHNTGATKFLKLNSDAAETDTQYIANDTAPSNSVITLGSDYGWNSSQSPGSILYAWRPISGFSKFGSYTGNGNTSGSGPRVDLGFKPAFLMVKGVDVQSGWRIYDSTRDSGGQFQKRLYAEGSSAESTNSTQYVNYDDTGFDVEASGSLSTYNVSGKTYVYMAFAQDPGGDVLDSLLDAPTNGSQSDTGAGGEVSGNYCTFNPLAKDGGTTYSNGNLEISSTDHGNNTATFFLTSGKWYWEGKGAGYVGAICSKAGQNATASISAPGSGAIGWWQDGPVYWDGNYNNSGTTSYGTSDIIGTALDMDNGIVYFYKNGSLTYTITFGDGTIPDLSDGVFPCYNNGNPSGTKTAIYNFGQRDFFYTAPSGYKALCTTNLPTPTIADGSDYFDTKLWTGNGSTQSITGLEFNPDWVWIKNRNGGHNHMLFDIVRGTGADLQSNSTATEGAAGSNDLTSFDSNGFSLGSNNAVNQSGRTFVAWAWDAGSSTVSNTDGSITTSLRANAAAGFSIATYSGSGTNGDTIGHGLGVQPDFVIVKARNKSDDWRVYHSALGTGYFLALNSANSASSGANWQSISNTTLGLQNDSAINGSGYNYVAYFFAAVAGYSAFGSFSSGSNPFVYLGFRPKFILFKPSGTTGNWDIYDTLRSTYNESNQTLSPNLGGAEYDAGANGIDILSNGFKCDGGQNVSTTYIYAAFAENPFQANGGLAR